MIYYNCPFFMALW